MSGSNQMTDTEFLMIERGVNQGLAAYARMCDERDWNAASRVFCDDAQADYGDGWHSPNRDAIVDMVRKHLGGCGPSQHLLGDTVVTVAADGEVTSRAYVRAAHRGAGDQAEQIYECLGEYHDRWVKTPAGWRIAYRRMSVSMEFGSRSVLRAGT